MFCNLNLTDMETCYKVFRTDLLKSIPMRSDRFGFEPEITMKSAKRKFRIYEVPISYHGRTYEEGKKIGWKDGVKALAVILRFWLIDDLYADPYGRGVLNNLTGTPQYLSWLALKLRPPHGRFGARGGCRHRQHRRAADGQAAPVRGGGKRSAASARLAQSLPAHAQRGGAAAGSAKLPADLAGLENCFDTVLCLNVLEYADDPEAIVRAVSAALKPGGNLILLLPFGPALYGSLDRSLGHKRRYHRGGCPPHSRIAGLHRGGELRAQ